MRLQPIGPEADIFNFDGNHRLFGHSPILLALKESNSLAQGGHLPLQGSDVPAVLSRGPTNDTGTASDLTAGKATELIVKDAGDVGHMA